MAGFDETEDPRVEQLGSDVRLSIIQVLTFITHFCCFRTLTMRCLHWNRRVLLAFLELLAL